MVQDTKRIFLASDSIFSIWHKKFLLCKHFDLLRISHSTVPMYAYECEMLVFVPFLTVCQRVKNRFLDTLRGSTDRAAPVSLSIRFQTVKVGIL